MNAPEILATHTDWIAVNKPSGMLTLPDRHDNQKESLKGWMLERYPESMVVHRLDKDTSGLILFARNPEAHKYLSGLFEGRDIQKIYHALVLGSPLADEGIIEAPIAEHPAQNGTMVIYAKGKYAKTGWKVLERFGSYTWMQFELFTGRTHQIRIHAKHAGFPVVHDVFYGDGKPFFLSAIKKKYKLGKWETDERPLLDRLALHAFSLKFLQPDGQAVHLKAPLHKDLRATLSQLEKHR